MRDFEVRLTVTLAPLTVIVFSDTEAILNAWQRAADCVASLGANVGGHADIAETSVMLALHPQKVRIDRFARGYIGKVDQQLLDRAFQDGIGAVSANGVLGDPEGASERIGEACLDAVTSLIADYARARGA
jgi:creatinine amidohydrolase